MKRQSDSARVKPHRSTHCSDCREPIKNGGYFWLKDEVWKSIAVFGEVLCVACTEIRLGRKLIKADFEAEFHLSNYIWGYLPIEEAGPLMGYCLAARKRLGIT
jgi:hypothetical protein